MRRRGRRGRGAPPLQEEKKTKTQPVRQRDTLIMRNPSAPHSPDYCALIGRRLAAEGVQVCWSPQTGGAAGPSPVGPAGPPQPHDNDNKETTRSQHHHNATVTATITQCLHTSDAAADS